MFKLRENNKGQNFNIKNILQEGRITKSIMVVNKNLYLVHIIKWEEYKNIWVLIKFKQIELIANISS